MITGGTANGQHAVTTYTPTRKRSIVLQRAHPQIFANNTAIKAACSYAILFWVACGDVTFIKTVDFPTGYLDIKIILCHYRTKMLLIYVVGLTHRIVQCADGHIKIKIQR